MKIKEQKELVLTDQELRTAVETYYADANPGKRVTILKPKDIEDFDTISFVIESMYEVPA